MTEQAVKLFRQGIRGGIEAAGRAVDLLLPPRCFSCGVLVTQQGLLCHHCWSELDFVTDPQCFSCGLPFEYDLGPKTRCAACLAQPPSFHRARALLRYDAAARRLLLPFKHADRTAAAPHFAAWMARAAPELLADCDLVAPVPLHWRRLWRRRYNQAALLAQALAAQAGVPCVPDLLVRTRATASQGHLSRSGRGRNVAGAFALKERYAANIEGARVLLVDDVLTTGATLEACTNSLIRVGAGRVDVLVMARVVR
ncbi:ComF family protein [Limibacillus sp. MBR-115]|uniref:ComF family protein n=1 Tax=Limibacillus sp. MBR-115 TaxID=3156465 RepID=UPI00339B5AB1